MSMRLSDMRYEQIKKVVVALFERYGVDCIPVDAWKLAHALGIRLISFSALTEEQLEAALRLSNGGLKFKLVDSEGVSTQYVLYDDCDPVGRQRFTILHEIAHIVLGHKQESELADAEADFFAKFAVAPPMLVHILRPADYLDIAMAFGLSNECAYNAMSYYNKWLRISGYKSYEYTLVTLFAKKDKDGKFNLRVQKSA